MFNVCSLYGFSAVCNLEKSASIRGLSAPSNQGKHTGCLSSPLVTHSVLSAYPTYATRSPKSATYRCGPSIIEYPGWTWMDSWHRDCKHPLIYSFPGEYVWVKEWIYFFSPGPAGLENRALAFKLVVFVIVWYMYVYLIAWEGCPLIAWMMHSFIMRNSLVTILFG